MPDLDISKLTREEIEDLYDTTPEEDHDNIDDDSDLNDGLTEDEIKEAKLFRQLKEGIMILTGQPGAGKDTVMHFILWKLKTLFKDFRVFLDRKPRILFGRYIPFNEEILTQELDRLDDKYRMGTSSIKHDFAEYSKNKNKINSIFEKWLGDNEDTFYHCGLGLGEFWRYFNNREPHNPINKAMQPFMKRYRHYRMLIIGTTPFVNELDEKRCLQYVTHEIRCAQASTKGVHIASIYARRYFNGTSLVEVAVEPIHLIIDALTPRERLNGGYVYQLFNSYERGEMLTKRSKRSEV